MGEFALVNYGTRWVLENTETGRRFDLAVADLFDRHWKAAEQFSCDVREFFGYESECERLRAVGQNVLAAVLRGIREGRWQLADGMTMLDVIETIRLGRYSDLDKIVVHSDAWKAATETIAELERRLAALKERCQPRAMPASATASSDAPAPDASHKQTLRDCHAARQALEDVRAARKGVDTSSQRAVERFARAERGIKQCAGLAQLNQAFATAQAASSDAAAAARRFVNLLERSEAAEKLVEDAKTAAAAAVTEAAETGDACTKDINDLIDAAAAAEADIPWDRLVAKVRAVGDAAVGVAESRGGEDSAAERQTLAACAELGDPFEDRLAAMNAILKLENVPAQRKQIERAAQECRDSIDAEAPPAGPVAAAASGEGTGASDATPGRARADPQVATLPAYRAPSNASAG